jgi:glutamate carboxypeptidase
VREREIERLMAPVLERESSLIERLVGWSGINSGSRHLSGVARMAECLRGEVATLTPDVAMIAFPPQLERQDDGTLVGREVGPGVRGRCRPEAPIQILLNGHLDTVFELSHPFQQARREGQRLVGPGVADMKGGLLVMLEALRILESAPGRDRIGWEVILNSDEEIGSPSSGPVLAEATRQFHLGLVFEPSLPGGALVSARPGVGNFLVRVRGRSAHVGRAFADGRSAVVALARLVTAFDDLNREPGVIVNIGRLSGGNGANIVPAAAACRLNVRADSEATRRWVSARMAELVAEAGRGEGIEAEVDGRFTRPPKPMTPAVERLLGEFRTCAREIGFDLGWAPTGGGSDGNILCAAGLPTVDSLGVRGGGIHTEGEFLEISSVTERISLTARFLLKLAGGDIRLGGDFDPQRRGF